MNGAVTRDLEMTFIETKAVDTLVMARGAKMMVVTQMKETMKMYRDRVKVLEQIETAIFSELENREQGRFLNVEDLLSEESRNILKDPLGNL